MVKIPASDAGHADSVPGWGGKIPYSLWPQKPKNIKQKQYINKFSKDSTNGPHYKNLYFFFYFYLFIFFPQGTSVYFLFFIFFIYFFILPILFYF